jgi:tRNA pseudouridine38-40 synthase
MATYKLTIEYDGTRFRGWQGQHNARSIQAEIVKAAGVLFRSPVDLQGSGRTDAGVHALAQVAHLTAKQSLPCIELRHGLNDRLPFDINIINVETAPKNFHARHDATGRSYIYQIAKRRTAFGTPYVWWVKYPLDTLQMIKGIKLFEGMHDFVSFCDRDDEQKSTKVLIEHTALRELPDMILVRIRASHFLWKMVRRLVGSLVEIGRHTITTGDLERYLTTYSQEPAQWMAPPSGLFLEQVRYKGDLWYEPLDPVVQIPSIRSMGF